MDEPARPTAGVVEVNAEAVMQQFYGAEEAAAIVVDEDDGEFELEVWYEGELVRDPRALTYESDDGWVQVAGIGDHLDENMVEMHYLVSRSDRTLGVTPLIERYDLRPTSHERVFVEEGVGEAAIQQGGQIANELPSTVVLAETSQIENPVAWGYLGGYDLVVVAYESSLPNDRTAEIIEKVRKHL